MTVFLCRDIEENWIAALCAEQEQEWVASERDLDFLRELELDPYEPADIEYVDIAVAMGLRMNVWNM